MKITDIGVTLCHPDHRNLVFVKVQTDEGITGIGEAYSVGPDDATAATVLHFKDWLIGQNPLEFERLWALMYNGSRFPGGSVVNSAISGIDQALFDIAGKALGCPAHQLLGGKCRDRVWVYLHAGGATPEDCARSALERIERYGCTAIKMTPYPPGSDRMPWNTVLREAERRVCTVREAVGDAVEIALDPHAKLFEPYRARQLAEVVAPFRPMFFEEPVRPENNDAFVRFASRAPVPVATGEQLYTKHEFRDLLVTECVDILQPDVCCVGGMLEMKKIAAMAEAFCVTIAPHNPMGPLANAVNVHLAAAMPNFLILEYIPDEAPPRRDLVLKPLVLRNGYVDVPETPGLGIELNEEGIAKYPFAPWRRGVPVHVDGSYGLV